MLQRGRPCGTVAPRHVDANLATRHATLRRAAALCRVARRVGNAAQHSASVRYPVINLLGAFSQISHYQEELAQACVVLHARESARESACATPTTLSLTHVRTRSPTYTCMHASARTLHTSTTQVNTFGETDADRRSRARTHTDSHRRMSHRRGGPAPRGRVCAGDC